MSDRPDKTPPPTPPASLDEYMARQPQPRQYIKVRPGEYADVTPMPWSRPRQADQPTPQPEPLSSDTPEEAE